MATLFKARINAILSGSVTPLLSSFGFVKRGNNYEKEIGDVDWLIDIQRSRFDDPDCLQFTMNCGVYMPTVTSMYLGRSEPARKKLTDCCIQVRIGMLAEDRLDKWWVLKSNDDVEISDRAVGEDMCYRLENHVIPFLNRFRSPETAMEFLSAPRTAADKLVLPRNKEISLSYAAAIAAKIGKTQEANAYLQKALSSVGQQFLKEVILNLQNRINQCDQDSLTDI